MISGSFIVVPLNLEFATQCLIITSVSAKCYGYIELEIFVCIVQTSRA